MQIQRTRRYRCALIPADMPADQVEIAASAGLRAAKVGQDRIKPGVWYQLNENGEFEEVQP